MEIKGRLVGETNNADLICVPGKISSNSITLKIIIRALLFQYNSFVTARAAALCLLGEEMAGFWSWLYCTENEMTFVYG